MGESNDLWGVVVIARPLSGSIHGVYAEINGRYVILVDSGLPEAQREAVVNDGLMHIAKGAKSWSVQNANPITSASKRYLLQRRSITV